MTASTDSQTVGRPMEILLVEDSLAAAKLTIGTLAKGHIPHHLTWLKSGEEALAYVRKEERFEKAPRPDLILLDLGLPGISGRDFLALVKENAALRAIPVVVMTASTAPEDRAEVEHFDVAAYLVKPVDFEKFLWLVRELKQYWLEEIILPHDAVAAPAAPPPPGALPATGSLGLFGKS